MLLYVHIPFCLRKCRYCDFVSFPMQKGEDQAYIRYLLQEARNRSQDVTEPIQTVYIGGGTPSLLSADSLKTLISGLRSALSFSSVSEFTVEANPGTLSPEWLQCAREQGVNRISLGMQACQESLLSLLGRIHDFQAVEESVYQIRKAGFQNLNLDLMFGIPTQEAKDWTQTLEKALQLHPEHISAYGLIPEAGTPLFQDLQNGKLQLPDPETERLMYDRTIQRLAEAGYRQYEISNFAREGFSCRHNIGYWKQIPYLGLGLSAASMLHPRRTDTGLVYTRSVNPADMKAYMQMIENSGIGYGETEFISEAESCFETFMLGLRMNEGVSETDFLRLHGYPIPQNLREKMTLLAQQGLMIHEKGAWRLTRRGMDIQNAVLVELMEA